MPELPEVETIVRSLRDGGRCGPSVRGRAIDHAAVFWHRSIASPGVDEFLNRIAGQTIQAVQRRGKYIVLPLSVDTLLIHLRMSGDIRVESMYNGLEEELPLSAHDRVVLYFQDQMRLAFNNPRKFGRVWLLRDPEEVLGSLGVEPLSEHWAVDGFYQMLHSRHRMIKPLLMDQQFIAGLGNIYTDESLFLAGLHPRSLSDSLTKEDASRLFSAIRQVLSEGIRANGASIDWVYRGGEFQNHFRVYQQTGKACPQCGHLIEKTTVGQRGTHFCPDCQKLR
ncbi:MAG: bifunctional DNA-formamidopyrimidine glycosylase/DNA-(apurinic or apyrimidinic site) lyase [Anaerolineaceae bacterium]|nr:bifunctional DNA-formamidopyrimidine glycosylase/DNA-(apurinic or apyrimidinic site) lyase [Anaerolineaceae bacterium]